MRFFLTLLFVLPVLAAQSQDITATADFGSTDITKANPFNPKAISVFGVQLTMSKSAVMEALNKEKNLIWEFDMFNTPSTELTSLTETRMYVYERKPGADKGPCLLYLIWNEGMAGLNRIVFFTDMKARAVGDTRKLFSLDAVDRSAAFFRRFLVKPDVHKNEDYTISDHYFSKSLQVIQFKRDGEPNDIYFALDLNLQ
ncbi:MAG: hypothetical protein U0X40_00835 [Ferruginibacter sp.]